jgi:acetolactate synthase-1/2/3 large subunit
MRVADQIVEFISEFCSPKVFLLTGNGAMYINDAMQIHPNIDYVCVRNEAVAPVAASAYSQISGKVGTVCVTAGPGAANAMPGVVEAWVDGVSIFVISGQVPSNELINYKKDLRTFGIAGIPIIDYVQEFTKLAISLQNAKDLECSLEDILLALRIGRPGPVWLDVPLDIQATESQPIDFNAMKERVSLKLKKELQSSSVDVQTAEVLNAIEKAKRPLFILGTGCIEAIDDASLNKWLGDTNAVYALTRPVAHKIPLEIEGNLGVIGVRGRPWSKEVFENTDLIVALGTRLPTSLVGANYSYLNPDTKILLINSEGTELLKHQKRILKISPISVEKFISDPEITQRFKKNIEMKSWLNAIIKTTNKKSLIFDSNLSQPLNLYWFCSNLEKFLDSSNVVTTDAGSNYYATGQAMTFNYGQREVTSGTFAAMGISVPLAIGASVAVSNVSRIICITGDGSIELNVQELQTISNYGMNIAIFVINNGGYASMRTWQDTFFESRYIGSTDDTGTKPMNFFKIAEAFNLKYEKISNSKDFEDKIENIVKSTAPTLVEVMCDPNQILELPMNSDVV